MKIAFITELFPPFTSGGSEWSIYYLAKQLAKNTEVIVLTPNFGYKAVENLGNAKIIRFPFYSKSKKPSTGNFFYTNPLWIIWVSFFIFYYCQKEKIDIIHIHQKYSVLPAIIANNLLKKPIIFTARDYIILCNYGLCLYKKDKSCNIYEFFFKEFREYYQEYVVNKGPVSLIKNFIFAAWGRITIHLIKFFTKNLPTVVLSKKQRDIFKKNGFSNVQVIGNSIDFENKKILASRKTDAIIYAGRLTYGKGVGFLIQIIPDIFANFPKFKFYFCGEGLLKNKLTQLKRKYKGIKILGTIPHRDLLKMYKKSKLTVVPSLWPEPFGRIALESIKMGTPVVASKRGGLPEIVKNNRWGYIVDPSPKKFFQAITSGLKYADDFSRNINSDYNIINKRFGINITKKYHKLYKQLLNR